MNRRKWVIYGLLGGLCWAWLGLGLAHAGVVPPTDPATLKLTVGAIVTVSLYQDDYKLPPAASVTLQSPSRCTTSGTSTPNTLYKDVMDCWLPEWDPVNGGKSVYVVVNGLQPLPTPTLVLPTTTVTP